MALIPNDLTATLVFVRHGESTYITEGRFQGRHDPALSALGERQAALVAARLANRDAHSPLPIPIGLPVGIWHSPLTRAAQTARLIQAGQPSAAPLQSTEHLTEIAQGEWEGQSHDVVSTRWASELAAWRRSPVENHAPGGESLPEAQTRIRAGVAEILASIGERGRHSVIKPKEGSAPGHSPVPGYPGSAGSSVLTDPWAVLVAHDGIFRIVLMTLLDLPLERFWSFPFNLCSISVVALREGVATLRAHNLSEHLAPIADEARAAAEARGDRRGAL